MNIFFYKLKLLLLRILCYEKPLRVPIVKYLSLKFPLFRPHYESLLFEASKNAIRLGLNEINIIELGVAGGNGIKSLLKYKKKVEKVLNIKINILGFDSGSGLPKTNKKEDLPFFWKQGDYTNQNIKDLEKNDQSIKIYEGNISSTLDNFTSENKVKIALILFDMDLYSSTKIFLDKIPELSQKKLLLPRVFCYFDDLFVADYSLNDINGEPLAISEFNINNKDLKLGKTLDHISDFKFPLAKGQVFMLHDFNNEDYNRYIGIYSRDSLTQNKNDNLRSLLDD